MNRAEFPEFPELPEFPDSPEFPEFPESQEFPEFPECLEFPEFPDFVNLVYKVSNGCRSLISGVNPLFPVSIPYLREQSALLPA